MPYTSLNGRTIIEIEGPDAEHFLQNVITTDLEKLGEGVAMGGALLTPQGKILADFLISRAGEEGFRLETHSALGDDLKRRLTMYRLRAKAEIRVPDESLVAVSWKDDSAPQTSVATVRDGRFREDLKVFRHYGRAGADENGQEAWEAFRIGQGIAECGSDYEAASAFPHDVLMDQNGGVSFRKGCFIGQEVVSRMQHRGTARRRVMIAEAQNALPPRGLEITADGKAVGQIVAASGKMALAMVRTDRVAEASSNGSEFSAGGIPVKLHFPDWVSITFPAGTHGESA